VQEACREHGIVLIFDEIITGFRVGLSGAQGYLGVTPDLATFGKAVAGGFPVSCLAGKRELMSLIADGTVNHSGTFNSNIVAMAAALATVSALEDGDIHERLYRSGGQLKKGLQEIMDSAGIKVHIEGPGPMFNLAFTDGQPVYDYRSFVRHSDMSRCQEFADVLLHEGVRFIPRGMWYLSAAHSQEDVEFTLEAAGRALSKLKSKPRSCER
jgi:glutamate-1-semialdehyde 2,1-aminomutase